MMSRTCCVGLVFVFSFWRGVHALSLQARELQASSSDEKRFAYVTMWFQPMDQPSTSAKQLHRAELLNQDLANPRGVMQVAKALRNVSAKYPLVLVTNIDDAAFVQELREVRPELEVVPITKDDLVSHACPWDHFPGPRGRAQQAWSFTFQKAHIFGLSQYDKLLWLDADIAIVRNVDYLFDYDLNDGKKVYAQQDICNCRRPLVRCSPMCSGVMLFTPSADLQKGIQSYMDRKNVSCWSDQPVISDFLTQDNGYRLQGFERKTVSFGHCSSFRAADPDMLHHAWNT